MRISSLHTAKLLAIFVFIVVPSLTFARLTDDSALMTTSTPMFKQTLQHITNFKVDASNMVSAGLPSDSEFATLKTMGISHVIDLLPGDRSEEQALMVSMGIPYHNIAVEWDKPTLQNFKDYVAAMQSARQNEGIILTHCKLNWRGAVFTYLYRTTQLNHDELKAKAHMLETWKPNKRWRRFIEEVKAAELK